MPRENKAADPSGKARKAAEDQVLRSHVAAANSAVRKDQSYNKRVDLVTGEVARQVNDQRGAKHTRS